MARGDRSTSKEHFWRREIQRWRRSGQTVRAYCVERGLAEPSFYAWRRTLAAREQAAALARPATTPGRQQDGPEHGSVSAAFVPVQVLAGEGLASSALRGVIEIVVATGRVVRLTAGFDAATLGRVLAVLEDRPC